MSDRLRMHAFADIYVYIYICLSEQIWVCMIVGWLDICDIANDECSIGYAELYFWPVQILLNVSLQIICIGCAIAIHVYSRFRSASNKKVKCGLHCYGIRTCTLSLSYLRYLL